MLPAEVQQGSGEDECQALRVAGMDREVVQQVAAEDVDRLDHPEQHDPAEHEPRRSARRHLPLDDTRRGTGSRVLTTGHTHGLQSANRGQWGTSPRMTSSAPTSEDRGAVHSRALDRPVAALLGAACVPGAAR
ncbi:hypothetical protein SDC9_117073 [bioreactor metagenome]|uniref:Uncharacterized protein n=1 Tax=bioreactor metagenome TaxID=1076179 RepID=A0A645BXB3_9ZZZZ